MKLIEAPRAEKRRHLERLLSYGRVMIFIDSRKPGVGVPEQHLGNLQLALNLDYAFEIPDFKILEDRVEVSLSFNQQHYFCILPYLALYAMTSQAAGEAVFFPEDMPLEFLQKLHSDNDKGREDPGINLTLIPTQANPDKTQTASLPGSPKKKGHLKLVK